MAKPRVEGASKYIGVDRSRINPDVLRSRYAERDQRAASDTRTDAQKWLGDPPPSQSALANGSQRVSRRRAGQRVDLWKK